MEKIDPKKQSCPFPPKLTGLVEAPTHVTFPGGRQLPSGKPVPHTHTNLTCCHGRQPVGEAASISTLEFQSSRIRTKRVSGTESRTRTTGLELGLLENEAFGRDEEPKLPDLLCSRVQKFMLPPLGQKSTGKNNVVHFPPNSLGL